MSSEGRPTDLLSKVEAFQDHSWKQHDLCSQWNSSIVIAGLFLSAGVAISGLQDGWGHTAGYMGVLLGLLAGLEAHFKFAKRAIAWHWAHAGAKEIRDRLDAWEDDQKEYDVIFSDWLALRRKLVESLPSETGLADALEH